MGTPAEVLNVQTRDGRGIVSVTQFYFNTPGEAAAQAPGIISGMDDLSEGVIVGASVTNNITLPGGIKVVPGPTSNVEHRGVFTFNTQDNKTFRASVPAIRNDAMVAGSDVVNPATAGYAEFVDGVLAQGSGTATDSRDELLMTLRTAVEDWTAKRKKAS